MKLYGNYKNKCLSIIIVSLIFTGISCNKYDITDNELIFNRNITINNNSQLKNEVEGIRLWMKAVTEDSRCPEELDCFWPGNGAVAFEIIIGHRTYPFTLNTYTLPRDTTLERYNIRLTDLKPWPKANEIIPQSDYKAEVFITKK